MSFMGSDSFGEFMSDPINILGGQDAKNAAKQQKEAQDAALAEQRRNIEQARADAEGLTGQSIGALQQGYGTARGDLTTAQQGAAGSLAQGYAQGRADMAPVQDLQRYGSDATTALQTGKINPYDVRGKSGIAERMAQADRFGQQIWRPTDITQDPGYQFRLQQGEQAINRSAAARGGRLGGATLKALAGYGSDLASQEYGAANDRQMQRNAQQMQLIGQQYGGAGMLQNEQMNQAGRTDAAAQQSIQNSLSSGLAAQQNQMGLAQMGYGAQGDLARMSQMYGQNSADQQTAYGQNMASMAAALGTGQAGTYGNQMQMNTALTGALNGYVGENAGYGGMENQAIASSKQNNANTAASIFGGFMGKSDERAKKNIASGDRAVRDLLSTIDPYTFDYIDSSDGSGQHLGVMAQDLEKSDSGRTLVVNTPNGKMINYGRATMALLGIVAQQHKEIEALKRKGA